MPPDLPPCPFHGGVDRAACREWHRVVRLLAGADLLRATDYAVVAAYCQAWSDWLRAAEESRRAGPVAQGPRGPELTAAWRAASEATTRLRALAVELGLTPSARVRVSQLLPKQAEDELAALRRPIT